jgi:hypothetical protein
MATGMLEKKERITFVLILRRSSVAHFSVDQEVSKPAVKGAMYSH